MRFPGRGVELDESAGWAAEPVCHPSASSSAGASTAPCTVRSISDIGLLGDDAEEEWPANPWQAQADAHVMALRQVESPSASAFGIPSVLCNVALHGTGHPEAAMQPPPQVPGLSRESFSDTSAQTGDELARRIGEMEGVIAQQEYTIDRRDQELRNLRLRVGEQGLQQRTAGELARQRAEVEGWRQSSDELKRRNEFLTAIMSRFERKTMGLERQLDEARTSRHEVVARAEEVEARLAATELLREELQVAQAEATASLEDKRLSQARNEELSAENAEQVEQSIELREAAESAGVVVRDLKKQHNAKVQELLRKVQALESRQQLQQQQQQQTPRGGPEGGSAAVAAAEVARAKEFKELKELNVQLIERLGLERSAHTKSQERVKAISNENETLTSRVGMLSDQLIELSDLNDALHDELSAASASQAELADMNDALRGELGAAKYSQCASLKGLD